MTLTKVSNKAAAELERAEAITRLRDLFAGDEAPEVRTILRHVSTSGMSRLVSLVYVKGGSIVNITYSAALALGWTLTDKYGYRSIRVTGCGMDMGFHTVYTLSSVLYRGEVPGDPGYKLKHEWL